MRCNDNFYLKSARDSINAGYRNSSDMNVESQEGGSTSGSRNILVVEESRNES